MLIEWKCCSLRKERRQIHFKSIACDKVNGSNELHIDLILSWQLDRHSLGIELDSCSGDKKAIAVTLRCLATFAMQRQSDNYHPLNRKFHSSNSELKLLIRPKSRKQQCCWIVISICLWLATTICIACRRGKVTFSSSTFKQGKRRLFANKSKSLRVKWEKSASMLMQWRDARKGHAKCLFFRTFEVAGVGYNRCDRLQLVQGGNGLGFLRLWLWHSDKSHFSRVSVRTKIKFDWNENEKKKNVKRERNSNAKRLERMRIKQCYTSKRSNGTVFVSAR